MKFTAALVVLIAGISEAQVDRPGVMAAPLSIRRVPAGVTADDKDRLQREFTRQLKLAGAQVPEFARVAAALKGFSAQSCERDDAQVAELARRAAVLYGLCATLDVTIEAQVVVQARVVRDDGEVTRAQVKVSKPRGTGQFIDAVKPALTELFQKLAIGTLPVQRAVPVKPPAPEPKPEPVVVAPPPPPKPEPVPLMPVVVVPASPAPAPSVAPIALLISGGAVALLGAAIGLVGFAFGSGIPVNNGVLRDQNDVSRLQTASVLATSGLIGVAVGAATAAGGLVLLLTEKPQVSLVPLPGGGAFATVGGSF